MFGVSTAMVPTSRRYSGESKDPAEAISGMPTRLPPKSSERPTNPESPRDDRRGGFASHFLPRVRSPLTKVEYSTPSRAFCSSSNAMALKYVYTRGNSAVIGIILDLLVCQVVKAAVAGGDR